MSSTERNGLASLKARKVSKQLLGVASWVSRCSSHCTVPTRPSQHCTDSRWNGGLTLVLTSIERYCTYSMTVRERYGTKTGAAQGRDQLRTSAEVPYMMADPVRSSRLMYLEPPVLESMGWPLDGCADM